MAWSGYKSRRWRRMRLAVLRRWLPLPGVRQVRQAGRGYDRTSRLACRQDYPEYAWELWNLISLSESSMMPCTTGAPAG